MNYRIATILINILNSFVRFPAMTVICYGWCVVNVISLFIILGLRDKLPPAMFFGFSLIALDSIIVISVILNLFTKPFKASQKFLEEVKERSRQTLPIKKWKYVKVILESCRPIKISSGDGKTFTRFTILGFVQVCFQGLFNLLLLYYTH